MLSLRKRLRGLHPFESIFSFPTPRFGICMNEDSDDEGLFGGPFSLPLKLPNELHADESLAKRPKFHSYSESTVSVTSNGRTKKHARHKYTDSNGVQNEVTTKSIDGKEHKQVRIGNKDITHHLKNVETIQDFELVWKGEGDNVKALKDGKEDKGEMADNEKANLLKSVADLRNQLSEAKSSKNYKKCISLKKSIQGAESDLKRLNKKEAEAKAEAKALAEKNRLKDSLHKLNAELRKAEDNEDFEECLKLHDNIVAIENKLKLS